MSQVSVGATDTRAPYVLGEVVDPADSSVRCLNTFPGFSAPVLSRVDALAQGLGLYTTWKGLSDTWKVRRFGTSGFWEIVQFPGMDRTNGTVRTVASYRPELKDAAAQMNTVVFTSANDGCCLDDHWTRNGLSCVLLIGADGTGFIHANPLNGERADMCARWNLDGFGVAFIRETADEQTMSPAQMDTLKAALALLLVRPQYIGDVWTAKGCPADDSWLEGQVSNMAEIQTALNLKPMKEHPKYQERVDAFRATLTK